jgi:hypothetical protein
VVTNPIVRVLFCDRAFFTNTAMAMAAGIA